MNDLESFIQELLESSQDALDEVLDGIDDPQTKDAVQAAASDIAKLTAQWIANPANRQDIEREMRFAASTIASTLNFERNEAIKTFMHKLEEPLGRLGSILLSLV